jgi:hypothetical protein
MASRWARISDRIRIVPLARSQGGLGYPPCEGRYADLAA